MELRKLRGDSCPDGRTCPAVHQTDRDTLMIIGSVVTDPEALAQLASVRARAPSRYRTRSYLR